jgi:hypothetical protein
MGALPSVLVPGGKTSQLPATVFAPPPCNDTKTDSRLRHTQTHIHAFQRKLNVRPSQHQQQHQQTHQKFSRIASHPSFLDLDLERWVAELYVTIKGYWNLLSYAGIRLVHNETRQQHACDVPTMCTRVWCYLLHFKPLLFLSTSNYYINIADLT